MDRAAVPTRIQGPRQHTNLQARVGDEDLVGQEVAPVLLVLCVDAVCLRLFEVQPRAGPYPRHARTDFVPIVLVGRASDCGGQVLAFLLSVKRRAPGALHVEQDDGP